MNPTLTNGVQSLIICTKRLPYNGRPMSEERQKLVQLPLLSRQSNGRLIAEVTERLWYNSAAEAAGGLPTTH